METLFTEAEVAERLNCSVARIRKLRAAGRLAFLPGRPVLVTERDFNAFVESERQHLKTLTGKRRKRARKFLPPEDPPPKGGLSPEFRGWWLAVRMQMLCERQTKR
ncbi:MULTISPECIES: helix-turn-helix domain-containing protein [Methylorubrum]|uniref:helix-turn-helix domain-containing protein n=1 Tax=Methylorubrum TaxID=2282523 RepID=UPI00209CEB13|nr:excisionase family DNA binding protein [Methylorubrum zatmanii]MCP1551737.1 excisionase family DNA binding protein [Methylorubrum extorquens]MCP1577287.1 excisionase family DNA binding protein [Methylorubrum extorquens]